jgi:hypothetical protein
MRNSLWAEVMDDAEAAVLVRMYASDNQLFAEDYSVAHTLLSELGCCGRRLAPLHTPHLIPLPPAVRLSPARCGSMPPRTTAPLHITVSACSSEGSPFTFREDDYRCG